MAPAMESADNNKLELGVVLAGTAKAFEDAEVTTPAAELLLLERGGGMLNQTSNAKNENMNS